MRGGLVSISLRREFWKDPADARQRIRKEPRLVEMFGDGPPRKLPGNTASWTPTEATRESGRWVRTLKKHRPSAERDAALEAMRAVKTGSDYAAALDLVNTYIFATARG